MTYDSNLTFFCKLDNILLIGVNRHSLSTQEIYKQHTPSYINRHCFPFMYYRRYDQYLNGHPKPQKFGRRLCFLRENLIDDPLSEKRLKLIQYLPLILQHEEDAGS